MKTINLLQFLKITDALFDESINEACEEHKRQSQPADAGY